MSEMELTESAEEALADLWIASKEEGKTGGPQGRLDPASKESALRELLQAGLVEDNAGRTSLTEEGERAAASIVRRERLAERLLADVLDIEDTVATEAACGLEHLLRKGIDDEICTLLGHPRFCPHGSPIPVGECCRAGASAAGKVISALVDLSPGQSGVIAYLHGRRREMMQRLLAMGAIPGARIVVLQRYPSYVFQLGHGQIAVDRETAQDIYVRLTASARPSPPQRRWPLGPFRGLRLRRGRRRT